MVLASAVQAAITVAAMAVAIMEAETIITVVEVPGVPGVPGVLKANPSRKTMKSRPRCQQNPRKLRRSFCFSLDRTAQHFACSVTHLQVPLVQIPGLVCSGQLTERPSFQPNRCHLVQELASHIKQQFDPVS